MKGSSVPNKLVEFPPLGLATFYKRLQIKMRGEMVIQSTPYEGIMMIEPNPLPQEEDVLIGYRLIRFSDEEGVFMRPRPQLLSKVGWVTSILMFFVCWPLTCVPCVLTSCYPDTVQIPVYGPPPPPERIDTPPPSPPSSWRVIKKRKNPKK